GVDNDEGGGGISVLFGDLTLNRVIVQDNVTSGDANTDGGGLFIDFDPENGGSGVNPTITITDSTFNNNTSGDRGGAIYLDPDSFADGGQFTFNLINSTLSNNTAFDDAGGLWINGGDVEHVLNVTGSTITGNTATTDSGGGIGGFSSSTWTINNSTITNNTAGDEGGGIDLASAVVTLNSSIVAGNTAATFPEGFDIIGPIISTTGHNLIGIIDGVTLTGTTTNNQTGTSGAPLDPNLGPLADNGGPTQTQLPNVGSPAINGGANALGLTEDSRGYTPRAQGGQEDIGAFESAAVEPNPNTAPLAAGDIVVLGYSSDGADAEFAIMPLVDLTAGDVIFFTDRGWDNANNRFVNSTEEPSQFTIAYTVPGGGITAGTVLDDVDLGIDISNFGAGILDTDGEQLLIYQTSGPLAAPTLVYGFNMNLAASNTSGWSTAAGPLDTQQSNLPPNGTAVTAVGQTNNAFGFAFQLGSEVDNAKYTGPATGADKAAWLAQVNNVGNWTTDDINPIDVTSSTFPTLTVGGAANNAPAIVVGDLSYTEGDNSGNPVVIDAAAMASDTEGNWDGGSLTIQITANNEAADEISIGDIGNITVNTGNGQISSSGVHFATATVNTATVTDGTLLTINFDATAGNATDARIQELVRAAGYRTTSDTPNTTARTATFTLSDDTDSTVDTATISVADAAEEVNLSVNVSTGTEAAGTVVTVTATASGNVTGAQTVNIAASGTGITAGDGTLSAAMISIADGATSGFVTFTILNDQRLEGDETATLTISTPSAGVTIGSTNTQNVTITDDETGAITFAADASNGENTSPTQNATLAITGSGSGTVGLDVALTVDATQTGGTATSGTDYTAYGTQMLTFSTGDGASNTSGNATLTVTDDQRLEGDETVILTIGSLSDTLDSQVSITGATHTATIEDNETGVIDFDIDDSNAESVDPTPNATLTITGSGTGTVGLDTALTVSATDAMTGSNQAADLSTAFGTQVLTIAAGDGTTIGSNNATLDVNDDQRLEGDETVDLTFTGTLSSTLNGQVSEGDATHTATIEDNETGVIDFIADQSNPESVDPTVNAVLSITGSGTGTVGLDTALTVSATDAGTGSATAGDLSAAFGMQVLTIAAGDGMVINSNNATLDVLDDTVFEPDDTVDLTFAGTLSSTLNGQVSEGDTSHTITIENDDNGLDAMIDGGGNLVIDESGGNTIDDLTISTDGTIVTITDATNPLGTGGIAGATGGGTTTITIPLAAFTGGIIINSLGNDDGLTVDFGGGANFGRTITFNGGSTMQTGGDDLFLQGGGTFASADYTFDNLNDGSIDITGNQTISYTGLEPITATITATDVTLNYSATAETIDVAPGGAGQTTVDSDAGEIVTFNNPTGTLTINAGATGGDTINVEGLGSGFTASLTIDGEGDTVNFQTAATNTGGGAVTVDADDINVNQTVDTSGGAITLTALNDVLFNAAGNLDTGMAATSTITITSDVDNTGGGAITMADGAFINGRNGDIVLDSTDTVTLGELITLQMVVIDSGAGSILDTADAGANDITAARVVLRSATGIGQGINFLETTLSNLEGNAGTGGVWIDNTGDVEIGGVTAMLTGISAGNNVDITTPNSLTVTESINSGGGNVALTTGVDTVINGTVLSGGGSITVEADNDVNFGAAGLLDVEMGGAGPITVVSDDDDAGGGAITMADGAFINGRTGDITLDSTGNVTLGELFTLADVTIDSGMGSILDTADADANDITADTALLNGATGVGQGINFLETTLTNLEADAGTGGLWLANTSDLEIGNVDAGTTGITANGNVAVDVAG
ncbi:MAG: beta strand repeat-containing protein, partial [Planctomycetales bacterium]